MPCALSTRRFSFRIHLVAALDLFHYGDLHAVVTGNLHNINLITKQIAEYIRTNRDGLAAHISPFNANLILERYDEEAHRRT